MKHVRDEFIKGVELVKDKEDMESVLGTQLVPAYKFIEVITYLWGTAFSNFVFCERCFNVTQYNIAHNTFWF